MTQRFTINSRLPGLNELLGWSTSFYLRGGKRLSKYTECKRNLTDGIAAMAKAARLKPVERCHLTFYWTEPNRRRDPDNTQPTTYRGPHPGPPSISRRRTPGRTGSRVLLGERTDDAPSATHRMH